MGRGKRSCGRSCWWPITMPIILANSVSCARLCRLGRGSGPPANDPSANHHGGGLPARSVVSSRATGFRIRKLSSFGVKVARFTGLILPDGRLPATDEYSLANDAYAHIIPELQRRVDEAIIGLCRELVKGP